ncbi:dTDP-4-dehydrorhamnose reductase [Paenibacillus sp. N1-5-1-14]|uniref:dTDP-4-dehydrorhamnose reductase n=1 Tax=Paenibacillus radicibacter TaxID=2972488 RepID=UPI0021597A33|nr:dTDP-4-dehydrorhamnose reductase [Paenibacillus radicibacter]MCR8645200.1 dTDP-4-dehydrorhamnose reductase [Paenibacillus radicibacter]
MKVLITGAGGQLGHDLIRVLQDEHEVTAYKRIELDITQFSKVSEVITQDRPDVIVHAAAFTNVDRAQIDRDAAYQVNATGAWHVAAVASQIGAKVVYVSTDYVFNGTKREAYRETDQVSPVSVYGASKLYGEQFTQLLCPQSYIVRTSWLYGASGSNFVTKVLAHAASHRKLTMVDDQFGSPTYTLDLAIWIAALIQTNKYGLYHVSNRGSCSRYEFARTILDHYGLSDVPITPIATAPAPHVAPRPHYSVFDDEAIRVQELPRMRVWSEALRDFLENDWQGTS